MIKKMPTANKMSDRTTTQESRRHRAPTAPRRLRLPGDLQHGNICQNEVCPDHFFYFFFLKLSSEYMSGLPDKLKYYNQTIENNKYIIQRNVYYKSVIVLH